MTKKYVIDSIVFDEEDEETGDDREEIHVFIPFDDVYEDYETGDELDCITNISLCGKTHSWNEDWGGGNMKWEEISRYPGYKESSLTCEECKELFEKMEKE